MQTDRVVWGVLYKYVDGAFNIRDLYLVNKDETVDQQIQRLIDEIELISDEYGKIPDMKIYVQERFVELKESMAKSKNKEIREHGEAEAVKQERLVLNDLEKVSQQMETRLSNLLAKFYEVTGKYYDIDHVFTDISDSWKNFIGDFIEKNKIEASRYIVNEYKYISPAILNEENYYYSSLLNVVLLNIFPLEWLPQWTTVLFVKQVIKMKLYIY